MYVIEPTRRKKIGSRGELLCVRCAVHDPFQLIDIYLGTLFTHPGAPVRRSEYSNVTIFAPSLHWAGRQAEREHNNKGMRHRLRDSIYTHDGRAANAAASFQPNAHLRVSPDRRLQALLSKSHKRGRTTLTHSTCSPHC
jgi:hypothetical protein